MAHRFFPISIKQHTFLKSYAKPKAYPLKQQLKQISKTGLKCSVIKTIDNALLVTQIEF